MRLKLTISIAVIIIFASIIINACRKSDSRKYDRPPTVQFTVPEGFPEPLYDFSNNPLTEEGFVLGRKLFHDTALSKGADVTCNSCHQQHAAYTTFDHDLGHGTNHQHTVRNVPVIFNMAWQKEFEWDGRIPNLDEQMLACLNAPEKMGETTELIINKLNSNAEYKRLFGEAFGDEDINAKRISQALSQFVVSLVSADSKYDRMKKGQATFNASEQNGYQLFQQKCSACHSEPLFTDISYRNNGLALNPFHFDYGRMQVTGNNADSLKFKVPTLRNITLTGYFAHDGRFSALSEMLNHYSEGIINSPTLDPSLQNQIPMTQLEKFYLEEFLATLSDSASLVENPRFAKP